MKAYALLISLLVIAILAWNLGNLPIKNKASPITKEVTKEVIREVIIEKPINKIIREVLTVEVPVEIEVDLEDWNSVEELQDFLRNDDTDEVLYLVARPGSGLVEFNFQCEDGAFNLRDRAAKTKRRLETELLTKAEYVRYYSESWDRPANNSHMINKAIIGNEVWYIEPATDRIWLAYYLD